MRFIFAAIVILMLAGALLGQSELVLQYDSGEPEKSWTFGLDGWFFTTRFTPPESVFLEKARFYIADTSNGATFHFSIYRAGEQEPAGMLVNKVPFRTKKLGWNEIDISEYGIQTDDDFYLSIEYDFDSEIAIGVDASEPIAGRSYDSDC